MEKVNDLGYCFFGYLLLEEVNSWAGHYSLTHYFLLEEVNNLVYQNSSKAGFVQVCHHSWLEEVCNLVVPGYFWSEVYKPDAPGYSWLEECMLVIAGYQVPEQG